MKKIIIFGAAALIIVAGLFLYKGDKVEYVKAVNDEVAALEADLAEIEIAVENGTLTPAEAVKAQVRIMDRLDSINAKSDTKISDLSPAQKTLLASTLERLGRILVTYRDTLNKVDAKASALPEDERRELNPRGSRTTSLAAAVTETLDNVAEVAEEMIEDFDANTEVYTEAEVDSADEVDVVGDMIDADAIIDVDTEMDMDDDSVSAESETTAEAESSAMVDEEEVQ